VIKKNQEGSSLNTKSLRLSKFEGSLHKSSKDESIQSIK